MRIEININELKFDIRNKSHLDVSSISDAEARYRAEAGTEKMDEVERCIINAASSLATLVQDYLHPDFTATGTNGATLPQILVYELMFSERRQSGKAKPLAAAMHSYLVNMTLFIFYQSVGQVDIANKRNALAASDAAVITNLVYSKMPPLFTR